MSEENLRGVMAVCITISPIGGRSSPGPSSPGPYSRDVFDADTARAQLDCEAKINRYGSYCTCGIHDAARLRVSAIES